MKYRVVLKVSYNEAWFDFDSAEEACKLAELLLTSMVVPPRGQQRQWSQLRY